MTKVILASGNKGKIAEFRSMFEPFGATIVPLNELPDPIDVEETGDTFEENARLKAETIANRYNMLTVADDSGLAIDALEGRPGVYSARYAGEAKDDQKNIDKVMEELKSVSSDERTARFYCVIAVAYPGRETQYVVGTCDGLIAESRSGEGGFGYDPIFYLPNYKQTMAEIGNSEKNKISHRAVAMQKLKEHWQEWTDGLV